VYSARNGKYGTNPFENKFTKIYLLNQWRVVCCKLRLGLSAYMRITLILHTEMVAQNIALGKLLCLEAAQQNHTQQLPTVKVQKTF